MTLEEKIALLALHGRSPVRYAYNADNPLWEIWPPNPKTGTSTVLTYNADDDYLWHPTRYILEYGSSAEWSDMPINNLDEDLLYDFVSEL